MAGEIARPHNGGSNEIRAPRGESLAPTSTSDGKRYIGGKTGGIDAAIFDAQIPEKTGVTIGLSGGLFNYETTRNEVKIEAPDETAVFNAGVEDGSLSFYIDNRALDGSKHPDIYAKGLVDASMGYFGEQGVEITAFNADWKQPGDEDRRHNWEQYTAYLDAVTARQGDLTDQDREDAARSTWSYSAIAQPYGFTSIDSLEEVEEFPGYKDIHVTFVKPSEE